MSDPTFQIRSIRWSLDYNSANEDHKLITPILLQDKNGPCPLIALVNTLLLKYELQLHNVLLNEEKLNEIQQQKFGSLSDLKNLLFQYESSHGFIESNKILSQLGEMLLVFKEDKSFDFEIDHLLESLPSLHTGLSVNPNLVNGTFARSDTILFSIFDLDLKHGWRLNQIDNEQVEWKVDNEEGEEDQFGQLIDIFNELQTFDAIQDYLLKESDPPKKVTEEANSDSGTSINGQLRSHDTQVARNQQLIKKWLELNKTQLTEIGLKRLNLDLSNEEFVIFFRNNHFNTLFKKNNHEFYLLITDSSFNNKASKIVWQSLNSVNGKDDLFFNGDFLPILDIDQDIDDEGVNDKDYLLTKQLQEEEDQTLAQQMQARYNKKESKPKSEPFRPFSRSKRYPETEEKRKEEKKKRDCTIV